MNSSIPGPSVARVDYLDWEVEDEQYPSADIVLGADIVYDCRVIPGLVNTLIRLLASRGSIAYIVSTIRNGYLQMVPLLFIMD